jgi:hypothetical protein
MMTSSPLVPWDSVYQQCKQPLRVSQWPLRLKKVLGKNPAPVMNDGLFYNHHIRI